MKDLKTRKENIMATKTTGVGTPGDSIPPLKKAEFSEIKKLDPKTIEVFKKNQVHGEYMMKLGTTNSMEKLANTMKQGHGLEGMGKQLNQLLESGAITQKEYNEMKAMIPKE